MMEVIGKNTTVVFGKVTDVKDGTGAAAGRVVNVSLTGQVWNGTANEDKTIQVAFWDNSDKGGANLADRARKAIKENAYVMIRCAVSNGKYSAQDFKYNGQYVIETDNGKTSVTLGNVTHQLRDGKMRYSVPVEVYENGENVTKWQSVSFTQKKQDGAEKCLARDDKSVKTLLIGYEPTTNTVGDKEYTNLVAYAFEVIK